MASKAAFKRLSREYMLMQKESPPFVWAAPDEKDILTWNYIIRGPPDSPYAGGEYHGVLLFPAEYPFKPPGIKMFTPSGRFQPDKRICFSMSDFHPGSWNPAWSVATILTGLVSFMLSDEMTTGSMTTSDVDKRTLASRSHEFNLSQRRFKEAFPDYCTPIAKDPPNMGEKERGIPDTPPPVPAATTAPPPVPPVRKAAPPASATTTPADKKAPSAARPRKVVRNATPGAAAVAAAAAAAAATAASPVPDNSGSSPSALAAGWRQLVWEKWRWGIVIALAVILSRIMTA